MSIEGDTFYLIKQDTEVYEDKMPMMNYLGYLELGRNPYYIKEENGTIQNNSDQYLNNNLIYTILSNKNGSSQNSGSSIEKACIYKTQTTEESTKKGDKIFSIKKEKKQKIKGRKKVNLSKKSGSKRHNKFSVDNLVQKIKTFFVNNLIRYINKRHSEFTKNKNKQLLRKLSPEFSKAYSKIDNQEFLKKSVKDFVSMDISKRCTKVKEPEYNKNQIENLYKKNEAKNVIKILDLNLSEIYEEYIGNKNKEFSFEQDLKEQKKNWEIEYIEKFKEKAQKLIVILSKKGKTKKVFFNPSKNCKEG
jgi:hypothetical protein